MSYCKQEGKDRIIFATKEDQEKPSTAIIIESIDEEPGLTLPNGDINWHCPCHGSDIFGPCAVEYRDARTCFHNSKADPRGSDCHDSMMPWVRCLTEHSGIDLLGKGEDEEEEEEEEQDDNGFHEALEIDRKKYESSNESNKVNSS
ncbi:hypothetical protein CHS0354_002482 [Potamilus streckersoni]|uniref:Uncharacterized protein n=1 Tax=Potamilus streckersoni TaxID=2493646 RepID=A0AAE0W8C6_9BIVA|nr:hypothetical protein CHS0354_002482 [Potamilus streckersoni]